MIPKLVNKDARIVVNGVEYHAQTPKDLHSPCAGCKFHSPVRCIAPSAVRCMPHERNDNSHVVWVKA